MLNCKKGGLYFLTTDDVINGGPARRVIEAMKREGMEAKIVLLADGPTHFYTAGFVLPLRRSVKWLQKVWSEPRTP